MLTRISLFLIQRAEKRIGVALDYTRKIAATDFGLLLRYNKAFGLLDPNTKVPPLAYHTARIRGALAADCGTCVEAEINLAENAGINSDVVDWILRGQQDKLSPEIGAVLRLADAVTARREDDSEAREQIIAAYGDKGLIELSLAMNGAALLPGIKRAMGYATACNIDLMRRKAG